MPRPTPTDSRLPAPAAAAVPVGPAESLAGYEVLVCICGGIAAYKTAGLVSILVQRGCGVTAAMTRSARRFIGPATLAGLTGRAVHFNPWRMTDESGIPHLRLSDAADLTVVAPATANVIGKLAGGIADDLVSALLLGAACPILLAPAMNENMWRNLAVQRNVAFLRDAGVQLVGPDSGWQACRAVGPGRMSEPAELAAAVQSLLLKSPPKSSRSPEGGPAAAPAEARGMRGASGPRTRKRIISGDR